MNLKKTNLLINIKSLSQKNLILELKKIKLFKNNIIEK